MIGSHLYNSQLLVRFGSHGSQAAVIAGRTRGGYLMARKYRAKSRSYISPVRVHPTDIIETIRRAEAEEQAD